MKNIIPNKYQEYLSLTLVLSFFIFHNILLIGTGMMVALYCMNKEDKFNLMKAKMPKTVIRDEIKTKENSNRKNEDRFIKGSDIKLIQTVEDFGYIPSLNDIEEERSA